MDSPLNVLGQRPRALNARRVGLAAWLWGEAGIGKTHLSQALLRETPCRSLTVPATLPLPELVRALPRPARLRPWLQSALDALQDSSVCYRQSSLRPMCCWGCYRTFTRKLSKAWPRSPF